LTNTQYYSEFWNFVNCTADTVNVSVMRKLVDKLLQPTVKGHHYDHMTSKIKNLWNLVKK